jgi:competence protein ComEA
MDERRRTVSEESVRDRLASLSRREIVGLVLIVVATLAGGVVWYVRSLPRPVTIAERPGGAGFAPVAAPTASVSPASLFVDVAGAVRHPGVYEFHDGDRVIDAIDAAGGQKPGATLDALNLAAPLADGAQVLVPGRAPRTQIPANSASALPGSGAAGKIDVNTADATELQELPGIGEVLSQAIVDYRTKNGPFTSVDELEDVSGIGPTTLADIRDLVTV